MNIRLYKKIVSLFLILLMVAPPSAVAQHFAWGHANPTGTQQEISPEVNQERIKYVLGIIGKLLADTDCDNQNQDAHKQYFCQVTGPQKTLHSPDVNGGLTEETQRNIELSILGAEIVGLAMISISYMLERKSIGKTFLYLTSFERMIVSETSALKKYIETPTSARSTMYRNSATLNQIFSNGFSKTKFLQDGIEFSWKSGDKILSKKLTIPAFQALVVEMSEVLPKSYKNYLTDFHSPHVSLGTDDLFKKRLKYAEEAAGLAYKEPGLRRFSLKIGNWGIYILIASVVIDGILTYNKHKNPPQIDVTPENINQMVLHDPHSLKAYLLEPYPEITEFLYYHLQSIPQSVKYFQNLKLKLGLD